MDIIQRVWGLVDNTNNGGNSRTQREMPKIKHCEVKNAVNGFIKRSDLGAREMPQVGEVLAVQAQGLDGSPTPTSKLSMGCTPVTPVQKGRDRDKRVTDAC